MNTIYGDIYGGDAWLKWRTTDVGVCPLPGEYTVVLTGDEGSPEGFVSDPLGLRPLYYYFSSPGELVTGKTLAEIVERSGGNPQINWDYLYSFYAYNFDFGNSTPYQNIFRIPAGQLLSKNKLGVWGLRRFFSELVSTSPRHFREVFVSTILERARRGPSFAVAFSGGFDSSLLLSILLSEGFPATALCLNFESGIESSAEALSAFTDRWGKERFTRIDADSIPPSEFGWTFGAQNINWPSLNLFKPLMKEARRQNLKSVWTGWGADEVFCRDHTILNALLLNSDIRNFISTWKDLRTQGQSPSQLLQVVLREFLPQPIKLALARFLPLHSPADLPRVKYFAKQARLARVQRQSKKPLERELRERLFGSGGLAYTAAQSQEFAAQYGLHFSFPFYDLRIISTVLDMPPQSFSRDGIDKYALRAAFADLLPEVIAKNRSTQDYKHWIMRQLRYDREPVLNWLKSHSALRENGKIDLSQLDRPWPSDYASVIQGHLVTLLYMAQCQSFAGKHEKKETIL